MLIKLLKSKVHNATVTHTDVNYHGSITIDTEPVSYTHLTLPTILRV